MKKLPKKSTGHKKRKPKPAEASRLSAETRARMSEMMRELNRKTGVLTARANQMLARRRESK